jgi:uncharacterized membrane protein
MPDPSDTSSTADAPKETARLEAFSDGVIAIIITLLVFSIRVPDKAVVARVGLLRALLDQWTMYLAFSASFFFILVMWINHHRLFTAIRRVDNNLLYLGAVLLAFVNPFISLGVNIALAIFFALPNRAVTRLIDQQV